MTPTEAINRLWHLVPENDCPDMRTTPDGYSHCGKCEACLDGEALSMVIDLARQSQGQVMHQGHERQDTGRTIQVSVCCPRVRKVSESETLVRGLRTFFDRMRAVFDRRCQVLLQKSLQTAQPVYLLQRSLP